MTTNRNAKPLTPEQAATRLEAFCAAAEHCRHELLGKLSRWGIGRDDAEAILARLARERYYDDERYARSFVRDHYRLSRWGRGKLRVALMQKRLSRKDIEAALQEIEPAVYEANLLAVLRLKARQLGAEANTYEGRTRLFRHAAARGYETALIAAAIRNPKLWEGLGD